MQIVNVEPYPEFVANEKQKIKARKDSSTTFFSRRNNEPPRIKKTVMLNLSNPTTTAVDVNLKSVQGKKQVQIG